MGDENDKSRHLDLDTGASSRMIWQGGQGPSRRADIKRLGDLGKRLLFRITHRNPVLF